ncbi:MAG: hypothetical protein AAGM38_05405 [Pseudomonadota bacterium]
MRRDYRCAPRGFRAAAALALAAALTTAPGLAQAKTPSHVHQSAVELTIIAQKLLRADFATETVPAAPPADMNRRPRHVYAKLRRIADQIAALRRLNGLPSTPSLPRLAKDITPADVFAAVATVREAMEQLAVLYGVDVLDVAAPFKEGKTPGDVYATLNALAALLSQGYTPAVVPNDVYALATALETETEALAGRLAPHRAGAPADAPGVDASGVDASGVDASGVDATTPRGETPADALRAVTAYAAALAALAARETDLAPAGGVSAPTQPTGPARPADVFNALSLTLADATAMRVKAGLTGPAAPLAQAVGKTPSDVFARIEAARRALESAAPSSSSN